jgi:hypothetical protein
MPLGLRKRAVAASVVPWADPKRVEDSKRATRPRKRRLDATEAQILAACLQLLAVHPRVAWAARFNSGMAMLPGRDGKMQPVRFGFAGCPDILGQLRDGRALGVEVKSRTGRLSVEQTAHLNMMRLNNAVAGMVRSADELAALLASAGVWQVAGWH